ncbi:hypothetical protein Micbo1qcDRAFT_194927 [Microdochium bolleyi]|uniref:Calpastatin n=1 Tax=Microdochium bolleyi TaxID=196109 RepID=A0A136J4B1_9PEZI|nr:hypothetical protein Micbo1qcDRAFT_194927 [Microdochium bolleyi]
MAGPKRTIDSYFRPAGARTKTNTGGIASTSASHSTSTSDAPSQETSSDGSQRRPGRPGSSSPSPSRPKEQDDLDGNDDDPHNLYRFLSAQDHLDPETSSPWLGTYAAALRQLRKGRKTSHWVWYVFPQMPLARPGPGSMGSRLSEMSRAYGIYSLAEARAYLDHEILGRRLLEITRVVLDSPVEDVEDLMGGETDRDKLLSCMTLFARAAADSGGGGDDGATVFEGVLDKYFAGERDVVTERALNEEEEIIFLIAELPVVVKRVLYSILLCVVWEAEEEKEEGTAHDRPQQMQL